MIGKFQIFGSENSTDYDVMVFVDEILDVESSHRLCKEHDLELAKILTDKPLNSNLAIIKDGFVVDVFKGVVSEENHGEWHLDHKIPISWATDEEETYKLNHYTNFQPLWKSENYVKGNRWSD